MKTEAESLFEEMCAKSKEAMNLLSKGLLPIDTKARGDTVEVTEVVEVKEDPYASQPFGPLFIEKALRWEHGKKKAREIMEREGYGPKVEVEETAKKDFVEGDVVYQEVRHEDGKTRCIDCKHHHPAVWEKSKAPFREASCKLASKFDTFYDTLYWTCPTFEAKEK